MLGVWTAGSHTEGVPQNGMYIRGKEACWKGPGKRGGGTQKEVRVAQSYGLFGQGTEIICEVEIVEKRVNALLDTEASLSMIRQKDLLELGFRCKDLKLADLRVVQADGREIKISGMICLPVMVGGVVTMQTLYVATTLCRSMILGRDWLEGNKAHMSFNPVMLKFGGK